MMNWLFTLLVLGTAWLLWSGIYQPMLLGLGLLSCLLALYLARRMGFFAPGTYTLHLLPRLPHFWAWLLIEIVKANLHVAAAVMRPRARIRAVIVDLSSDSGPIGQTLLANAITLTPGTITLDVDQGRLRVHCLTPGAADGLLDGRMQQRVAAVTRD